MITKKFGRLRVVAALLLSTVATPSLTASAQGADGVTGAIEAASMLGSAANPIKVSDPSALAQAVRSWIDDALANSEQAGILTESLIKYTEMVEQTKRIYETVAPLIESGEALYELYRQTTRIYDDFDMLIDYLALVGETGQVSRSSLRSLQAQGMRLTEEVKLLITKVKAVLSGLTAMNTKDRLDEVAKAEEQIAAMSETVESSIETDVKEKIQDAILKEKDRHLMAALGMNMSEEEAKAQEAKVQTLCTEVSRRVNGESDTDSDGAYAGSRTVSAAFDFVFAVIGVLAVLMLVWAYGRKVKGDPQHQDTLWKVFAGLVFVLLLMQILRVTLFSETGMALMTIPNF